MSLAKEGPNLDADREPVDTIVIHHTSSEPGYRIAYMNATQMLNVYVPYFADPSDPKDEYLKGLPLWSNHVRDGQPVFYLYHWLLRMDGSAERLLNDDQIGWHAGNWEVNCRSVGICLDNNYENKDPDIEVLQAAADLIAKNYPQVPPSNIVGHKEVRKKGTTCPGANFLSGWKPILQSLVEERV